MVYFVLLPIFIMWLLLATAMVLLARLKPSLQHMYPIALGIAVWSSIGFIAANLVLILLIWIGGQFVASDNVGSIHQILQLVFGLMVLVGPIAASAIGWAGGLVLGCIFSYKKSRVFQQAISA